jgi:hypothetical protein
MDQMMGIGSVHYAYIGGFVVLCGVMTMLLWVILRHAFISMFV